MPLLSAGGISPGSGLYTPDNKFYTSVTWNPNDCGPVTLSADLCTLASSVQNGVCGCRATQGFPAGKYYFEITWSCSGSNASQVGFGFVNDLTWLTNLQYPTNSYVFASSLSHNNNDPGIVSGGVRVQTSNAVMGDNASQSFAFAVDLIAMLAWLYDGVGWNTVQGGGNPALGTNGVDCSAFNTGGPYYPGAYLYNIGTPQSCQLTANFGLTPFMWTPPACFYQVGY